MSTPQWSDRFAEFGDVEELQREVWQRVLDMVTSWDSVEPNAQLVIQLYFTAFLAGQSSCPVASAEFAARAQMAIEKFLSPRQLGDVRTLEGCLWQLADLIQRRCESAQADRVAAADGPENLKDIIARRLGEDRP